MGRERNWNVLVVEEPTPAARGLASTPPGRGWWVVGAERGKCVRQQILRYNPELKTRARHLRQHMTRGEVLLWNKLKQRQVLGYHFSRQRPIAEWIVDFFCPVLSLAIEIDGSSHDLKEEKDRRRDRQLADLGVYVLRFWDAEVKNDIQSVVERIEAWIRENAPSG